MGHMLGVKGIYTKVFSVGGFLRWYEMYWAIGRDVVYWVCFSSTSTQLTRHTTTEWPVPPPTCAGHAPHVLGDLHEAVHHQRPLRHVV